MTFSWLSTVLAILLLSGAPAFARSVLDAFVDDLPLSSEAKLELASLAPERDPFDLRVRNVLGAVPAQISDELRTFLAKEGLSFGLDDGDLAEYEALGYVPRLRYGSLEEARARALLSRPTARVLEAMGEPSASLLSQVYTVQSLLREPGVTKLVAEELRKYVLAAGFQILNEGGYSDAYDQLSSKSKRALRKLNHPTLARLRDTYSVEDLIKSFGESAALELAEFARANGFELRDTRVIAGLSARARNVLRSLGDPPPKLLASRYTRSKIRKQDGVGDQVEAEFTKYIERHGFTWRAEITPPKPPAPVERATTVLPPKAARPPARSVEPVVLAGTFGKISARTRKLLLELGDPSPAELDERETITSLVERGAKPPEIRELHQALKRQGLSMAPGPGLKFCGSYLVGNGQIYVLD